MTVRDALVAHVAEALRAVPSPTNGVSPVEVLANAAVDAVAIFVYEQLADG